MRPRRRSRRNGYPASGGASGPTSSDSPLDGKSVIARSAGDRSQIKRVNKTADPLEGRLDLVETRGIGTANVPRTARSEGIAGNDGHPRLMQQPGREIVRRKAGRGDRGEGVERARRQVTVQSEPVQPADNCLSPQCVV